MQDLLLSLRRLRREPGFALAAVATLALGVAISTAVFSVVDGVLLRPLPFAHPERLAFITREGDVSIPDGVDWRASSKSFESIALFLRRWALDLTGTGEPQRLSAGVVEPQYFDVLGMQPLLGRALSAEDERPGAPAVAVLSFGFWKRQFGGDAGVLGRTITLSDAKTTVVGVMPPGFDFLDDRTDVWVAVAPFTPWALPERGTNNFDAIGRLKPGVSFATASAEMRGICERLAQAYPRTNRGKIVEPLPMLDFLVGGVRKPLLALLSAVGLLLLIGCANLASLLLARSTARQAEYSLRLSLGASRARLLRQLLAEGLVLSALGGAAGLALAAWTQALIVASAPASLPRLADVRLSGPVLAVGLAASVLSGLAASLIPAL
jgi:putative ABC transport system permease protein